MTYKSTSVSAARFLPLSARGNGLRFTGAEWLRLAGFYGVIVALHVAGWGLYLYYSAAYPALVGLGFVAYMFGLRHAFDADHIAAVDDTVRFMLQKGKRPLGIGFFFSLGHSTIVLLLAVAVVFAADSGEARPADDEGRRRPDRRERVRHVPAAIAAAQLPRAAADPGCGGRRAAARTATTTSRKLLAKRGFLNRLFGGRLQRVMSASWHMYPLGLLFGLGFDTASEIGLLAMTAGASAGNLPSPPCCACRSCSPRA